MSGSCGRPGGRSSRSARRDGAASAVVADHGPAAGPRGVGGAGSAAGVVALMGRRHVLRVEGLEVESPWLRWSRAGGRWLSRWRAELAVAMVAFVVYRLVSCAADITLA